MQSHCAVPTPTSTVCPAGEEVSPLDGIMSYQSTHGGLRRRSWVASERASATPSDSAVGVLRFNISLLFSDTTLPERAGSSNHNS